MADGTVVHIRMHPRFTERADELLEWFAAADELCPSGSASRVDVLREAIRRGLADLERQRRDME